VFTALANKSTALGLSIQRLPPFMNLATTTFVNLRAALPDVTNLVNATKSVANPMPGYPRGKLYALLQQLEPLAIDAVPTVKDLSTIISRPGARNDLIDLNHLAPPLAQATVGHVFADGKLRRGAFPVSAQALTKSVPELAVARPYAVDLTGWFEGYSHPGVYDANGATSRVAPVVGIGSVANGVQNLCTKVIQQVLHLLGKSCPATSLLTTAAGRLPFAKSILTTGQGDRCPGSMERGPQDGKQSAGGAPPSGPYYPESGFPCNPKQIPTGP
jgi:phospholipid/cholesterol/gamma-HCH transport system substrate-binding protein